MDPKTLTPKEPGVPSQNQTEQQAVTAPNAPLTGPQMTADEIAAFDDRPIVTVLVPEWKNRVVTAREPDAGASLVILRSATNDENVTDELDLIVKTVVEACIDPKFTVDHIPALKTKSEVPLTRIFKALKGKKNEPTKV